MSLVKSPLLHTLSGLYIGILNFAGEVIFYVNGRQSGDTQISETGYMDTLNNVFLGFYASGSCPEVSYAALEIYDVVSTQDEVETRYAWEYPYQGPECH